MAATILVFALLSIFYYDYNYYTSDTQPVYDDDDDEEKPHSVEVTNSVFLLNFFVYIINEIRQRELSWVYVQ